ncbi:MAG TPA: hypothetical protein VGM53_04500 [Streptosporangiaceae bacterium]|jgi:hypothetical protein
MFASPNTASIMSAVLADQRSVAAGVRATFQNSGTALSDAVFFALMIAGLAASLPGTLMSGLQQHGVSHAAAPQAAAVLPEPRGAQLEC